MIHEQQQDAFSEKSKIFRNNALSGSKIASNQRSDSPKLREEQQLSVLRKTAHGSTRAGIHDIFHRLFTGNWLLQRPSSYVFCIPHGRNDSVLCYGRTGKFLCFFYYFLYNWAHLRVPSFSYCDTRGKKSKALRKVAINDITCEFIRLKR